MKLHLQLYYILVIWDVQRFLVNSIFNCDEFIKNLNILLRASRATRVRIAFTRISPLLKVLNRWSTQKISPNDLALSVAPTRNDVIIDKSTTSIFIGNNFEYMARNVGIITLIFTGISTEVGIESSARDTYNRGFLPRFIQKS